MIRRSPSFGHFHTIYATIFAYLVTRFIILRPLFSHFYTPIFAYLVARCIMKPHKSATFFSRHYGTVSPTKHESWGTIGNRPHVYKGLHSIWALLHCLHTHFGIFSRLKYNVPPHKSRGRQHFWIPDRNRTDGKEQNEPNSEIIKSDSIRSVPFQ